MWAAESKFHCVWYIVSFICSTTDINLSIGVKQMYNVHCRSSNTTIFLQELAYCVMETKRAIGREKESEGVIGQYRKRW